MLRRLLELLRLRPRRGPLLRAGERIGFGAAPPELVAWAEVALQAGLVLRLGDLEQLTHVELVALAAAGRRREVQRTTELAVALSSPLAGPALAAEVDGGEALDDALAEAGLAVLAGGR